MNGVSAGTKLIHESDAHSRGKIQSHIITYCLVDVIASVFFHWIIYESFSDVGEIRVWWRADFQSGSRVLKKVF